MISCGFKGEVDSVERKKRDGAEIRSLAHSSNRKPNLDGFTQWGGNIAYFTEEARGCVLSGKVWFSSSDPHTEDSRFLLVFRLPTGLPPYSPVSFGLFPHVPQLAAALLTLGLPLRTTKRKPCSISFRKETLLFISGSPGKYCIGSDWLTCPALN